MKRLICGAAVVALAACQAPIDPRGAPMQTAGRCQMLAYKEDRPHIAFGLIPAMIVQANADQRRQAIYDSCLAAGGSRESPMETLPLEALR